MSPPTCPTCTKPINPTHAPVARIRGAKIVTFCSPQCAEGKPAPAPEKAAPPPPPSKLAVVASQPAQVVARKPPPSPRPSPPAQPPLATDEDLRPPRGRPSSGVDRIAAVASEPSASEVDLKSALGSGSPRKGLILACAALVIGGAGLVAYDALSAPKPSAAKSSASVATVKTRAPKALPTESADVGARTEAFPVAAPDVLYDRAVSALKELRGSPSRRIQRLATMALARVGDEKAIEGLRALLASEESSLNRMALAYALARAGGDDGRAALTEGLAHDRRDVRSDASIALLNLGDDAGRGPLLRMTSLRHYKISACGHLARAGDAKAKRILERIYKDRGEDAETKLRAAVALGRAGDASVAEYLRSTLADGRFQVGAADALAALGDKSAIKPLSHQLELNAMRVRAALALRRLGAEVPLGALGVALTEDDEVTRVTAAEATLILTGPEELAARD